MIKYIFNKFAKQRTTSRWARNNAEVLMPHLPATLKGLMRKTKYSKTSVEKFLVILRQNGKVITVQAGKKTWYEERINNNA